MAKIKFELKEATRANTLWMSLDYYGGDADSDHHEEWKFDFPYSEWQDHIKEIEEEIAKYKILKKLTGITHGDDVKYEEIEKEYGKEIADMYEDVPNDPQGDFQFKTVLDYIYLVGYDEKGNKYQSYT